MIQAYALLTDNKQSWQVPETRIHYLKLYQQIQQLYIKTSFPRHKPVCH